MNEQEIWNFLTQKFKNTLSKVSYDTWIGSADLLEANEQHVRIKVPSTLQKDYWERNLITKVVEYLYEFTQKELTPQLVTEDELKKQLAPTPSAQTLPPSEKPQLVENYTFDRFVIGKGNQMAHAAALVVSEEPGEVYNPLFFYGGVGLGKTHLMHAIGHQHLQINPQAKIKYVTSEKFANDFINSIQNRTSEQFRQEYRNVDLLLVDDIQFFADKEGTQEEFFHTFNTLFDHKKQIVLTSDRLPNEIPKLEERLVSRFEWGLSVDITPPDLETRIAILRKKADANLLDIPDDTLSYIAGQFQSNIRELEGALVRVQAYATMQGSEITTSLAADALKSLIRSSDRKVTIDKIQETTAKYYQVSMDEIKGKSRVQRIVIPRQVSMYLAREITDLSLPKIGAAFGGKDHTTVLHAHDKISELEKTDRQIKQAIQEIKDRL
ncbi:chromosomal replication initiator protein DnaA [Allofustis seminis]|uniref:chromosomal replication initiator protein DnaA n=1 Tax=Allofustis seminis TaxID=166939 RepID=UPI0003605CAF|nr:chromosomal replication initiator protein DnaA [Allofustis seminis]